MLKIELKFKLPFFHIIIKLIRMDLILCKIQSLVQIQK